MPKEVEPYWDIQPIDPVSDRGRMNTVVRMLSEAGQYDEVWDGEKALRQYRFNEGLGVIAVAQHMKTQEILGTGRASFGGLPSLSRLYVKPEHEGRGIGTDLANKLAGYARLRGVKRLVMHVDTENDRARTIYREKLPGYNEYTDITHGELDTHHYREVELFSREEEKTPEILSAFDTVHKACEFDHGSERYVFGPILDGIFRKFTDERWDNYDIPQDKYSLTKTYILPETYMSQMGVGEGYHSWAMIPLEYRHSDSGIRLLAYYGNTEMSSRTLTKSSGLFILQHNNELTPFCADTDSYREYGYPDGRLTLFWSRHLLRRLKFNANLINRIDEDGY